MSSTNFRSMLIFASCVVGMILVIYYMGEFLGGVLFLVHYSLMRFCMVDVRIPATT